MICDRVKSLLGLGPTYVIYIWFGHSIELMIWLDHSFVFAGGLIIRLRLYMVWPFG